VVHADGSLFLLVDKDASAPQFADLDAIKHAYGAAFWSEPPRRTIMALRANDGEVLWASGRTVLPVTLATAGGRVFFHNGRRIVCLDRKTGDELWVSEPIACTEVLRSFYAPTLLVYDDVVLFSGGETAGQQTGSWYMSGKDTMTALSVQTGEVLWTAYHPPSGYRSAEDLLVANGLVWTGETTSGRAVGVFTGRDPHTGDVKHEFPPAVDTYWFHHRCYRGKATDNYLLMSRTGTEFIDVRSQEWTLNHWVRGACLYGVMPANGLLYAPQHPCACYLETKLFGFNALAPADAGPRVPAHIEDASRLEKGPAYRRDGAASVVEGDWPTYRGDMQRSGMAKSAVPASLKPAWEAKIGGRLSSPVVAGGKVFVAAVDAHRLYALNGATGNVLWSFAAGGRIDSPPTFHDGRVFFGSADGCVYALDAADAALAWRFRAAPVDQRTVAFEQVESVWPVHGSVLIRDGVLYCVAGRSMFLDGGLRLLRLDPQTGRKLSETLMTDVDPQTGQDLHTYVSWLNMPTGLPDILSSTDDLVYMRSQPFRLNGTRLPLKPFPKGQDADKGAPPPLQDPEHAHLFSPTGFLDGSYWHRTYWMYGSRFVSGWCGYYLAGRAAPAGRILVFDDEKVYGFGRKPQYYRWTTPIEHHLFAADKSGLLTDEPGEEAKGSCVRVAKSASLNPTGKALTVEAWVKAERAGGVVLSRGGGSHGYALYFKNGRPQFAVRVSEELASVGAGKRALGRWVHLAGVMTADKELYLYVDGKQVATAQAPSLITSDPAQPMEIAADEGGGSVGDYAAPFAFKGLIDEVRVYHRALSDAEINSHASSPSPADFDKADLVLSYSFDAGKAKDASGRKNNGTVLGATADVGKIGQALRFTGKIGSNSDFFVTHAWTQELPLLARAMVLAERTLFVAGPPDVIDEEQMFKRIDDPAVRPDLAAQAQALTGHKGALLMAVSAEDGAELARYELDSPPVFDGMAAAGGRLYLTTVEGQVRCFGPARREDHSVAAVGR
jgi:outer membrane protein assembly factor BamB